MVVWGGSLRFVGEELLVVAAFYVGIQMVIDCGYMWSRLQIIPAAVGVMYLRESFCGNNNNSC